MHDQAVIDDRALSKLKWRCRRGLLENDLLIERFFARHGDRLTPADARGLMRMMDLDDNDLLDLLLARDTPAIGPLDDDAVRVLRLMRAAPPVTSFGLSKKERP